MADWTEREVSEIAWTVTPTFGRTKAELSVTPWQQEHLTQNIYLTPKKHRQKNAPCSTLNKDKNVFNI